MALRHSKQVSFDELRLHCGRGGPREGAGRKCSGRRCDPKRAREAFDRLTPVHVTLRLGKRVPSLRNTPFIREIRESFRAVLARPDFRLIHYSFQRDHVHLIVEAENQAALGRGMMAINTRIARAAQRTFRFSGSVLAGPYHVHLLRSPKELHRAIRYVLLNVRKHWCQRNTTPPPVQIDIASSARWFKGFAFNLPADRTDPPEVGQPTSWLFRAAWKTCGPIDPAMVPGST